MISAQELPNAITLMRIFLSVFLNYYIYRNFGQIAIPLIVFLLILITDFLDGKIVRLTNNTSSFGAVLDVGADLFFILLSYSFLSYFQLLPLWFLLIIILKFLEFATTSYFLKKGQSIFIFDLLGRISAGSFYLIPMLSYISFHLSLTLYFFTTHTLLYLCTTLALLSSLYRVLSKINIPTEKIL